MVQFSRDVSDYGKKGWPGAVYLPTEGKLGKSPHIVRVYASSVWGIFQHQTLCCPFPGYVMAPTVATCLG